MPGNSDYDSVLKTILAWPKQDQTALLHAVVDSLAAVPPERPVRVDKPTPPPLPPVAASPPPISPPPPASDSRPAPNTQVGRPWVDETST